MTVRAKFRCMSVTKTWDGYTNLDLRPVCPNGNTPCDEETKRENATFFKWTPTGELHLSYFGPAPFEAEPGAYYYIDLDTPAADGTERPWFLLSRSETVGQDHTTPQLDVWLEAPWQGSPLRKGDFKMGITNDRAWGLFLGAKRGQRWAMTITRALTPAGLTPAGLTPAGLTPAGLTPAGLTPAG